MGLGTDLASPREETEEERRRRLGLLAPLEPVVEAPESSERAQRRRAEEAVDIIDAAGRPGGSRNVVGPPRSAGLSPAEQRALVEGLSRRGAGRSAPREQAPAGPITVRRLPDTERTPAERVAHELHQQRERERAPTPPLEFPAQLPRPSEEALEAQRRRDQAQIADPVGGEAARIRRQYGQPTIAEEPASDEMINALANRPRPAPPPGAARALDVPAAPRAEFVDPTDPPRAEMITRMAQPGADASKAAPREEPDYTGVDVLDVIRNIGHRLGAGFSALGGRPRGAAFESMGQAARARDAAARRQEVTDAQANRDRDLRERQNWSLAESRTRRADLGERQLEERAETNEARSQTAASRAEAQNETDAARRERLRGQEGRDAALRQTDSSEATSDREDVQGMMQLLTPEERAAFGAEGDLDQMNAETLRSLADRMRGVITRRRRGGGGGGGGGASREAIRQQYVQWAVDHDVPRERAEALSHSPTTIDRFEREMGTGPRIAYEQGENREVRVQNEVQRQIEQNQREWTELDYMHEINGQLGRALDQATDVDIAGAARLPPGVLPDMLSPAGRRVHQLLWNMRDALARERTGAVINESEYAAFGSISGMASTFHTRQQVRAYIRDTRRARRGRNDTRNLRLSDEARAELERRRRRDAAGPPEAGPAPGRRPGRRAAPPSEGGSEGGTVSVISPSGQRGTVPTGQLEAALRAGYHRAG